MNIEEQFANGIRRIERLVGELESKTSLTMSEVYSTLELTGALSDEINQLHPKVSLSAKLLYMTAMVDIGDRIKVVIEKVLYKDQQVN